MKHLIAILISLVLFVLASTDAFAQAGFNPEFLGNAAGTGTIGFALKSFASYFYQHSIAGHDVEFALEPQAWLAGFSGEAKRDQVQFLMHVPVGYRTQDQPAAGRTSLTGIGTLNANIEHFWHLIDEPDVQYWLDHAITAGFPTATDNEGVRIGNNAFSIGAFQEMFIRHGNFLASIMPLFIDWTFEDRKTDVRPGLSLGLLNSSIGYQVASSAAIGISCGLSLGSVMGSREVNGDELPVSIRAYAGPAFSFSFPHHLSLQVSGIVDVYTKDIPRGQGIFVALWHLF